MASSISQPVGIINGSNFVQPADDNEVNDFDMEDTAGGNVPPPLDRGNGKVS